MTTTATLPSLPGAEVVCPVEPREAWLDARAQGIGSSDAPLIVLGKLYGRSRHDLFLEKSGLEKRLELDHPRLMWGHLLEPVMRQEIARETGREVIPAGVLLRSRAYPYMQDSPDGFVRRGSEWGCLELKVSSVAAWDEGVPEHVEIQALHHMAVTGLSFCTVGVLRLGYGGIEGLYWIDLPRDDDRIGALTIMEGQFWEACEMLEPPSVDGSPACKAALARLYPEADPAQTVPLPAALLDVDGELVQAKAQRRDLEERITYLENCIKAEIGPAGAGALPDGTVYRWSTQTRAAHQVPESTFRVLRRKAGRLAMQPHGGQ